MKFSSYFLLSFVVVLGVIAHAYVAHEQFYPAVVYLSTDKMCLAVMYNFAFALFLLFGKVLLQIFIGTLRDLEVEQLVDSGRGFLADTILFLVFYAPTIDNREVGTVYLIQYICCVIFMKVFHLTTQIRVSHMFEVGVPRLIVNIKLVALVCLLLCCDLVALNYFYSVASRSSTFFTWILFEALTMFTMVIVSICKYSIHMFDLQLDNGWPLKSVCLFYIDLVHDIVSMTLFLVFMLTFFVQNPSRLPIYMLADVIQVARKLAQRLRSFRRYRRISRNMEMRFPDATDEEINQNEHCVICRDSLFEGSTPKKLPCNHIFHIDCLRSWLVMQQVCPTCRAEISADAVIPTPPAAPAPQVAAAAAAPAEHPAPAAVPQDGAAAPLLGAQGAAPAPAAPPAQQAPGGATAPAAAAPVGMPPAAPAAPTVGYPAAATPAPTAGATAAVAKTAATPAGAHQTAQPAATQQPSPVGAAHAAAPSAAPAPSAHTVATAAAAVPQQTVGAAQAKVGGVQAAPATVAWPPQAQADHQAAGVVPIGVPMPLSMCSLGAVGVLPPLEEIVESLKRAEEVAKFLRQQTDFWMEQVQLIQQGQMASAGSFAQGSAQSPFLFPGGAPTQAGSGDGSGPGAVAPTGSRATPSGSAAIAAGGGEADPASPKNANDQMAELRRAQQEAWERKRSSASLGENETTAAD